MTRFEENTAMRVGLGRTWFGVGNPSHPFPKAFIAFILILLISSMFPHGESIEMTPSSRAVWTDRELIAPFPFPIYKDLREYEREKDAAARGVYPIFVRNDAAGSEASRRLGVITDALYEASAAKVRYRRAPTSADSITHVRVLGRIPFRITEGEWNLLEQWLVIDGKKQERPFARLEAILGGFLSDYLQIGILNVPKNEDLRDSVAIRKGTVEHIVPTAGLLELREAISGIDADIAAVYGATDANTLAEKVLRSILQPNLIYDSEETKRLTRLVQEDVPLTVGFVQENETIVSKDDRITELTRLKLDSFRKARAEREVGLSEWRRWVGIILHVAIIITLFGIYIFLFRKKIYQDNSKLLLIALLLFLVTAAAHLTLRLDLPQPIQYLIFVPAASMLLTILFDSRVAFYGTVTMALLIAGIRGSDYTIGLASLTAGAMGAYTVRDIRNRTQIFRSLGFIFIGYAVPIIGLSLEQFESAQTILMSILFALANAAFSPLLTYGLLIFFERMFHISTDLSLLELTDFNRPLLRQLSEKAPGTFHHSMLLGTMAESAAEAIGANSVLARVGAYYHDIGKMLKPEYFVENQVGTSNKHIRLKPSMSALIIAAHVKEGMELGRQYELPESVLGFIPQHHGTTRISFFYDKALRQAARRSEREEVREIDFRYPGPRPQTREAGIVMLADSVEASTRVLGETSPQVLESAIDQMIKQRFLEGQLDECALTSRDMNLIKESFLKILVGTHHQRIQYPMQADHPGLSPEVSAMKDPGAAIGAAPNIDSTSDLKGDGVGEGRDGS